VIGKVRNTLIPNGFSSPVSWSVNGTVNVRTPASMASVPAGAFQTPRSLSVRAVIPATAPLVVTVVHHWH
jgi:hypothetical protein